MDYYCTKSLLSLIGGWVGVGVSLRFTSQKFRRRNFTAQSPMERPGNTRRIFRIQMVVSDSRIVFSKFGRILSERFDSEAKTATDE